MALTLTNTRQDERAARFVAQCRQAGFSPSETAFLADQRAMFDRKGLRGHRLGPIMLMDFVDGAGKRICERLAQIKTPQDLADYRRQWATHWIGEYRGATTETCFKLLDIVYKSTFVRQVQAWMDLDQAPHTLTTWDQVETHVARKMIRGGVDRADGITPVPLKQAMKQVGLHTLTWSRWLYPTAQDEALLGGALVAFNEGLVAQTGLSGPVLGLGGGVRLHMDDDTVVEEGGMFSGSFQMYGKTAGKNAFGTSQIRIPSYSGFQPLAHEWFHAFDCMMGDPHRHTLSSQQAETPAAEAVVALAEDVVHGPGEVERAMPLMLGLMRQAGQRLSLNPDSLMAAFDQQVAQGTPAGGWGQWAQETAQIDGHQVYAVRSLGVIGAQATGVLRGKVDKAWLDLYPDAYHAQPGEQMAYAFERSCLHTGVLPTTAPNPVWVVRSCIPSELAHTHQVLQSFFSHPQIQAQWGRLTGTQENSPLLDKVAARRLTQRRGRPGRKPA